MSNTSDNRIMNRIKIGDEIKHIDQEILLNNLDAYAKQRGSDRVYVTNPEGKRGTVELRELKSVLDAGFQLIDDTEGYNNRPDIIEKRKSQQETTPRTSAPIDVAKTLNRMDDSPYGRTIGKQQTESSIGDIIAKDTRPIIEQAAAPAKEAAQVQVPRLPWQSNLEYAETVMAAQKRENERFQEQMMQEARHAVPESTQEIISSIDAIDSELEELTGEKAAEKLAESYYTSPEQRMLFQIGKKRPKELSEEQRQRVNELQEQKRALQVQYDLLNKFKKYEDFDKDADRNALGRFFGGMYAEGDMQALATFGLSRMQKDLEFIGILEKARNGRKLSSDEQKAIQLYQNLQEIQSKDRGAFFSAGTGMQTTFEFMRDMALFGFGGLAKTATNQGVKQIVKQSLKNYGKKTAEIFLKAPITPSFYKNLTANQIANYEIKEGPNGTWDINQKESSLKNLYRTYAETTTEFASEALGNVFENIGLVSRLAKSAGKGKGILSKAVKTYDRIHNKALHNKWGKFILNGMEQMGLNNMPSEFLEEIAVIPMQSLMLWENQFDQLADPRFYQEVAISTAALGGMHSAVNIAVGGPSALIERRKINKELDNTRSALVSIRDTQIGDTPEEVKIKFAIDDILADVDNRDYYNENYEFTAETIINHLDKLRSRAGSNSELIQQAENYVQLSLYKEGQTEAMRAIVEDEVGAFEYGTSGGVMLGTTNDGRQVFILDEAGKSVTVRMMEKDAQPEVISRDDIQNVQTYTMDAFCTDYFVGKRPGSTQIETIEDIQQMDQQAQQPAESIAIVAGETALYDGTPVEVIDTYDNNNMVTVRDANGQTHSVPAEDLQGVAPSQNKTIYISPTGERYIEIGQTPDRRYLIQRLDDNNMPIQDTLVATSEELMQYDKLDPQEADAIEEVAQQVTGTLENEPGAIEESTEDVLPVDKDGNIDYDTLLVQSPQRFLQEFSNVVGEEAAVQQLKSVVANVDQKIEQVTGKLNKATSLNESIKLQQEIAKLQSQRDSIQSILQSEENSAPVEETIPAEQEIISASEEISPDVEETMTVKEEINPISEEIGTETEEIGTVEVENQTPELTESVKTEPAEPKTILESALDENTNKALEAQAEQVNTEPTEAQKEAGNYKMGHVKINGFDITIENPKGSIRSGIDNNGVPWEVHMNNHYGYFRGTKGKDGDQIDVFVGDSPTSGKIFIVDQVDENGNFDEHKVMMGFDSIEEAQQAYMSNYSPGWNGLGNITEVSVEDFKEWAKDGRKKTQPFASRQENASIIPQADEVDEYGNRFVLASDGSTDFGLIDAESGLKQAPIRLSMGDNTIDEKGNNHGYGLLHIEAERGDAIRKAGYSSVQEFVESVAKNYTDIREGGIIANNQTYLLELVDEHNNTLFIQLSKNGDYWTINSAGIFRKKYSRNKRKVYDRPALGSDTNTDISGVNSGQSDGVTTPAGNSPQTSANKGKQSVPKKQTAEQQESLEAPVQTATKRNRLVDDEKYAQLKERMRKKLSQLNVGIDPEMLSIGIEMAVYHIENGAYKFADYTRKMVADLGDAIRPYLKAFYNGARDLPGMEEYAAQMDSYADVSPVNVNDITVEDTVEEVAVSKMENTSDDAVEGTVAQVESVPEEPAQSAVRGTVTKDVNTKTGADIWVVKLNDRVERDEYNEIAAVAKSNGGYYSRFKKGFIFTSESDANNFNNLNYGEITDTQAEQRSADTIAVVSQAETVVSQIGSQAEAIRTADDAVRAINECDRALASINEQLALLGYYQADYNPGKFNESYGYIKTAEQKALKDAEKLAKSLAKDLGIDIGRKKVAKANIAPAGGDITFRLPLNESKQLYVDISLMPNSGYYYDKKAGEDDLFVRGVMDYSGRDAIMYRVEDPNATGMNRYGVNNFANADATYQDLLSGIKRVAGEYLTSVPEQSEHEDVTIDKLVNPLRQSSNPDFNIGEKVLYNGEIATIADFDMGRPVLDTGFGPVMYELANWNDITKYEPQTITENGEETVQQLEGSAVTAERDGQPRVEDETVGSSQQPQVLTDEPAGVDTDSSATIGDDTTGDRGVSGRNVNEQSTVESGEKNTHNWRYPASGTGIPTSVSARLKANIAAIKVLRELQENNAQATPGQMEVLSRYSGWGGMGTYFNSNAARIPGSEAAQIKELLTDEEYSDAVMSLNSAYYTPVEVINTLWDVAQQLGFKGGNILEGSAGTGNILGFMPEGISSNSNIEAVEIDSISGSILSYLYPDAQVHVQGFEKTAIANNSVDLAITNVPFVTGLRVNDPIDKDLSRKFKNIHDFCIAKNVRKLREGGIGIFITSNGTLDKSKQLREWLVSREGNADVIGAFRLNNRTFEGAPVTSDIIVVRKRVGGIQSPAAIDVLSTSTTRVVPVKVDEKFNKKTGQYEDITRDVAVDYNTYFQQHPEYMGGEMAIAAEKGDTFRPASVGLYPSTNINQEERMKEWVSSFSPVEQSAKVEVEQKPVYEQSSEKEGSLILDKQGRLCISRRGEAVPLDVNDNKIKGKYTKAEALKDYNALKQALNDVLQYQVENDSDEGLSPLLKKLNTVYDNFVKKYGPLNRNVTISFLRNDVDFTPVAAIEKYSESETIEGKKKIEVSKTDVFKGRVIGNTPTPTPTNVQDGIILSVQKNGYIDVDLISQWLGMDKENVLEEVISSRMGFINPANSLLEVRHEYLSGNVREKLAYARANNQDNAYTTNIEELEKVVPMDIPAHLIEFSLGSTWIDPKLYSAFVEEKYDVTIDYTNINGVWVADRDVYANNEKNRTAGVYSEMVGKRVMGHELFLAAMNNTPITVSKTVRHYNGTTETITDKQASQMCTVRMQEIKEEFKDWARARMQADAELAEKMTRVYNDKFNAIVPKTIDDVFTPERFEGANKVIDLYPHQKKAVIRATTEPLMLAHEVGTGKTFTLITTAMEMRRLGTAKKPMIVVQNATVGQFVSQAKFLYPNAKVLTISDKDRTAEGRKEFYAKIKYNDWDLIVVPQSVFEMIPDNETRMRDFVQEKIDEKMYAIQAARDANLDNNFIRQLENELKQLEEDFATGTMQRSGKKNEKKEAVAAQNAQVRAEEQLQRSTDDVEDFDEMGIDALLVDEAHEYKHLGFATSMKRGVKGVDPSYSKKAASVYLKARAVLEKSGGKNVVFATGTPISNTAAEIWTFMRYLMPKDTMVANDIYYFDDFVRNFGNITQNLEFATNGKFKENTRFASYVNLPELVRLWGSVSDTVLTKEVSYVNDKVPEMETGKAMDIFLPQSPGLVDIMRGVRQVLEEYDKMTGKEKKANSHIPLTMYGIAKRAAIDPRLVDSNAIDEPLSKTNRAVEETLRTLEETKSYKGTVAIFCDSYRRLEEDATGKKKETFNLFQEIKRKLVTAGVPASQIVIMESGMSIPKKEKVFADVNAGNVRVILGSTQTLGTGVNIQQRLHTLIHMDAPDRPMDYTQRNGRILRQGNLHKEWGKEVRVLRFGVEDSLDVTSYQRLKTKSSFIDSVMDSKPLLANNQENRTLEEEEEGLFDNPVAVLSGSQYALLKSQAERELRKWQGKYKQWEADQVYVNAQLKRNAAQLEKNAANMTAYEQNLAQVEEKFPQGTTSVVTIDGIRCTTEEERIQAFKEVNKKMNDQIEQLRNNPYGQRQQYTYTLDFDGMPVEVTLDLRRDSRYNEKIKGVQVSVHRDMKYNIPALDLTDVPVSGAYIKGAVDDILENVITGNDARERIAAITKGTKRLQEENKLLSARDGKPFEYTKELNDARDKVEEYTTAMKKELQEKEAKYADMGTGATVDVENIIQDDDSAVQAQIVDMVDSVPELTYSEQMAYDAVRQALSNASIPVVMATDKMVEEVINAKEDPTGENNVQFEIVTDDAVLNQLESGPTMKVYRAMQLIDGELYPPMSAVVNGKLRKPIKLGVWEQAEENPELADNKGYFKLDKGNKKSLKARYNPYIHTSTTPLNDQFSEAQSRPNLVTVEVEIPVSELTSGYKAEKAKDPVGRIEWKAGVIQSKISGKREVILSRWDKPVRIVPDSEVAEKIVEMFDGRDITMPSNVVTPSLRNELEKRGINFVETDNRGKPIRFSIDSDAENVSERAAIIENAKAAGTYLKAPNGQDTNLTPEQWVTVRTQAFKKWFGDWTLTTLQFPIIRSENTPLSVSNAKKWMRDNIIGQSITNDNEGFDIYVGNTFLSNMYKDMNVFNIGSRSVLIQSIPSILKSSIPVETFKDSYNKDVDIIRLCGAIEINGSVKRVETLIGKTNQGYKLYSCKMKEMELSEKSGNIPNREGETPRNGNISINSISGANLLKGVKKNNSNEDLLSSSKILDENREPKVVYHGSNNSFPAFDSSYNNKGYKGFFFTDDKTMAESYGNVIYEVFLNIRDAYTVDGYGKNWNDLNVDVINITDNIEEKISMHKAMLKSLLDAGKISKAKYDYWADSYYNKLDFINDDKNNSVVDIFKKYIYRQQISKFSSQLTATSTRQVERLVESANSEANIIFKDITDYGPNDSGFTGAHNVYVITNPKHVKSATDNLTFSAESNDIRFSIDSVKKSRVGTVRGWTKDGVVYLTKDGLNPETPIHEYSHIWADAVQKYNPALWNNIKSLLKRLPQWQQVVSDVNYQDIAGNEDAVASEVLARYSGKRGAKRLEQDAREFGQATGRKGYAAQLLQKVKKALEDFWNWVNVNLFNISGFSSAEEIADRVLYDLVSGTDLSHPATITQEILKQNTVEELLGNEAYGNMMGDVFSGIDVITQVNMVKGGDRQAQTRKYIADVCSDVANRNEEAMQIVASVRKAFQDKGMMLDISDADLLHKMWQENNSEPRQTLAESLAYENKSKKVQFSIESDMGPTTNDIKLNWWETQKERWIDRMHSVAVLKKIVTTRHGTITADTDPYMSENLASARSMHEIDKFKKDIYEPLLEKVVEVQKLFVKLKLSNAKLAYKAVNDYLYAMHAPERNKRICVEEVVDKMMKKLSKEEQKFFKSANVRDVLIALVGRMYNERQNPKTPFTSDIFATNIVKGAAKTKEENDLLNEFRKKFTDLTKTARTDIDKIFKSKRGTNRSGMSDQEARDILAKYVTPETKQILEDLSNIVRRSNDFTLKTWLKYSLIDQDTYGAYKEMYKNYIPLRSWAEKEDVDYDSLGKQAFNHASEIINLNRKAYGRSSRADDPIAYIGSLAQSAVVVGNKNMVHLNAFRLVQQNKDILEDIAILPQIYYVEVEGSDEVIAYDERPPQEYFDKGMVTSKTNRSYRWHKTNSEYEAHTVPVIINGVRYMIVFKGNIGVKIASALNNTNVNHWAAADALRPLTRWLSAVRTSYSPEFVLVNFVRDFLFGNIAYAIEGGNVASLNKNLAAAFKAINKSALGKRGTSKIDRLYEEFQSEGGQTGFIHMRKLEQIKKENEVMRRKMAGQRNASDVIWRNWLMRMGKGSMEYLSVMSENAMRFAVYMTEREKGTSAKEAAYKAHEITVNFNRKGTYSGNMNAFYSFFNASVQGTYRLWQLGKQNPKRTAVALTSLALVKLLSAAIAAMVGGDDYDELSDYVKFSNIIIPTGTDDQGRTIFFTIPMPQGMRAVSNLSDVTVDVLRGNKTVWDAISTFTLNAVGEFVPLSVDAIDLTGRQSGQSIVAPFVPTAIQPFFDVWSNRDFKGDPIYKEDFTRGTADYTPAYKKVYGNANPVMVGISKWINNIAGGSDEMSSAIKFDREDGTVSRRWYGYAFDINPASAEHLINGYLGGMSTFVSNILKTANAIISEDVDLELYNLPVAGRFVRQAYYKEGYNTWYEVSDMVKDIEAMERALQREKDWDGYRAFKQNAYNTQLVTMFNMYDDRVKQLRDITKSGNLSAQEVKKYNKEVDALISKASKEFEQIMERYEEN